MTEEREPHFYHLTPVENVAAIRKKGIRADEEGEVFIFTDLIVANVIAKEEVGTDHYAVFEIDPRGITGKVEPDLVAEFSASFQLIVHQEIIDPRWLTLVGEFETIYDRPTDWDYMLGERLGQSRKEVDARFRFLKRMQENPSHPGGRIVYDEKRDEIVFVDEDQQETEK